MGFFFIKLLPLSLLICLLSLPRLSLSGGKSNLLDSVPDLEKSMYTTIDGYPCVRLLNLSGEIGCANPGRDNVVAPVVRYQDGLTLSQLSAILLSLDEAERFFSRVATDPDLARNVAGVLIEAQMQDKFKVLVGFSPDEKFPQSKFSPYKNLSYEWNPNGSGIMWNTYNFPVFLLGDNSTSIVKEVSAKNLINNRSYNKGVAEFGLVMQTTKSGTRDSKTCLKAGTCLPLGGYSVWSSLLPINVSSSDSEKPIILAMASMDSASFFRDKSLGADSPLSGLIALLAAADALSHSDYLKSFKKQLVFLIVTGEAWGFLGSRRFIHELEMRTNAVAGLDFSLIETVMEIGSVGKGFDGESKTLYAHLAGVPLVANETFNALQRAQISLKSEIHIAAANPLNPGIPPSSLMSFLKKNSQISGVVLEDFDAVFSNGFYHSHLDDIANINSTSVVAAASLVARSMYILAGGIDNSNISELDAIHVNVSLVDELLDCLLKCDPGLSCGLVKSYISPSTTCPNNYVGVLVTDPSSPPYPGYSSDISRFVWNFLADRTAKQKTNGSSNCLKGCTNDGEVCVRGETNQSACLRSNTRYISTYSTRLKYESETWRLLPPNSSDPMSIMDPVWTESNWDVIGLRVYTIQERAYNRLILLAGLGITGFSYFAIEITKTIITKALKRD